MSQRDNNNYYEILEVPPDAAATEIHKAYQRARTTYSQDNPALYSMFSVEEARELLRLIDEAYNVLGNQATRKTYDDTLVGRGGSSGTSIAPVSQNQSSGAHASHQGSSQSSTNTQMSSHSSDHSSSHSASHAHNAPTPINAQARSHEAANSPARSSSEPPPISMASFDSQSSEEFVVKRRELQKAAAPVGQGRTSLSTFKLDESFENEIASATEFDGGFIQRVRLYKNVSIDKMSDATRISRPYLMAVETNDYKSLPAAVFVRGFVVQIARQLGIDDQKVAASYMKLFKAGGGK